MSARTYEYLTKACVLGVIAAALLYGRSEAMTIAAVALGTISAIAGGAAYFLRLLPEKGSAEQQSRCDRPTEREESIQGPERLSPLLDRDALPELSRQALEGEFVMRMAQTMLGHYYADDVPGTQGCVSGSKLRHATVRYQDVSRYFELSMLPYFSFAVSRETTEDYILDFATKLYASEAGRDIECELTRDGTLIIRHNSKKVTREGARSGDEEPALDFGDDRWPHLVGKPI